MFQDDFCLSGISRLDLESIFHRIVHLDSQIRLNKLVIWDWNDHANRTSFEEGTNVVDAVDILEFNFREIKRFTAMFSIFIAEIRTRINISAFQKNSLTYIEGQLYLNQLTDHEVSPEQIFDSLINLLTFLAKNLDPLFLNISEEDNEQLIFNINGIRLPSLLGIYSYQDFGINRIKEIQSISNKAVTLCDEHFVIIRVVSSDELAEAIKPNHSILEKLCEYFIEAGC